MSTKALDYELDDYVEAVTPQQLRAIGNSIRANILDLVFDRAATTAELAESLQTPKGTVGYHVKVLEAAGLIRVVRTRQVRGVVAKYYGRVGRTIVIRGDYLGDDSPAPMLTQALGEAVAASSSDRWREDEPGLMFTLRHVRLSQEQVAKFVTSLQDLAVAFSDLPREGDTVYGFIGGVYPTNHPVLRSDDR
jgi:DNA-binding transcriptional ArsR family regulator